MGEKAVSLPQRDAEAVAFIERGLAEHKTIKQILTELHAQPPYSSWGRPGLEKQWAQVWRPALVAKGKAPTRVLKQLSIRQDAAMAAPAPAPAGPAARTPAGAAAPVASLRDLLRPLAELALGGAPEPARLLETYARAQLMLDDLARALQEREQAVLEWEQVLRAQQQQALVAAADSRRRLGPARGALDVVHRALGEVLEREGGPEPAELAEVAALVRTRLGQVLKQLA